jgi:hypothetical protein
MLVLRRSEGQWVEVTHRSGDVMRIRVYDLHRQPAGQANLAFDDPMRNFTIHRPERFARRGPSEPSSTSRPA